MNKEELIKKCLMTDPEIYSAQYGGGSKGQTWKGDDEAYSDDRKIAKSQVKKAIPIIVGEIFDEFEKLNLIPPDKYEDWCEFKTLRERWEK